MTLMPSLFLIPVPDPVPVPVPESSTTPAFAGPSVREPIQTRLHRTVIVGLPFFSFHSSHLTSLCNRGCYINTTVAARTSGGV